MIKISFRTTISRFNKINITLQVKKNLAMVFELVNILFPKLLNKFILRIAVKNNKFI